MGCEIAKTIPSDYGQLLLFRTERPDQSTKKVSYLRSESPSIDTLIYKFDNFVELNKNPISIKIDSIIFHSGVCFGTCPDFEIKMDKNGNAIYRAGMYSKQTGLFKGEITPQAMNNLTSLLSYMHPQKLKDSYAVNWTDSPTCNLTIKFADGSVKKISDYGELGTFGLVAVYKTFFELTSSVKWDKAN